MSVSHPATINDFCNQKVTKKEIHSSFLTKKAEDKLGNSFIRKGIKSKPVLRSRFQVSQNYIINKKQRITKSEAKLISRKRREELHSLHQPKKNNLTNKIDYRALYKKEVVYSRHNKAKAENAKHLYLGVLSKKMTKSGIEILKREAEIIKKALEEEKFKILRNDDLTDYEERLKLHRFFVNDYIQYMISRASKNKENPKPLLTLFEKLKINLRKKK